MNLGSSQTSVALGIREKTTYKVISANSLEPILADFAGSIYNICCSCISFQLHQHAPWSYVVNDVPYNIYW